MWKAVQKLGATYHRLVSVQPWRLGRGKLEACPDNKHEQGHSISCSTCQASVVHQEWAVLAASWWVGIWRQQNSDDSPVEITCQACNDCLSWRSRFCRSAAGFQSISESFSDLGTLVVSWFPSWLGLKGSGSSWDSSMNFLANVPPSHLCCWLASPPQRSASYQRTRIL